MVVIVIDFRGFAIVFVIVVIVVCRGFDIVPVVVFRGFDIVPVVPIVIVFRGFDIVPVVVIVFVFVVIRRASWPRGVLEQL